MKMEFQLVNVFCVLFVVLLVTFTAGEMDISPQNPAIEDILSLWELWITGNKRPRERLTPHLPPHLNFAGEKEDCDISPQEQLSVEYIRRFIDVRNDPPSSKYAKGVAPEKILGGSLLFFLQQTRFLTDFSKNTRTGCLDENRGDPKTLVCLPSTKKCRPCDFDKKLSEEDKETLRKVCNIQISPPFKYDPEIETETLSHRKLPEDWPSILRMTPEEFTELESRGSGDIPENHYAFPVIFGRWEEMMSQVSRDDKSCSVTFDDQFQLATGAVLMGMEDRRAFGARNLFFLLRNLRDFHAEGKTFCRRPSETAAAVCSPKGECVNCGALEDKIRLTKASFELVGEEEKVMMTLCRFQFDPRSTKRIPWKGVDEEITSGNVTKNGGKRVGVEKGGTRWRLFSTVLLLLVASR